MRRRRREPAAIAADRPVVRFDESPIQLIGEVRQPVPAVPGQIERMYRWI